MPLRSLACLAVLTTLHSAALAQEEVVTITATKRATPVFDVPASVVVIDGNAVNRGADYLGAEDLVEQVAGLQAAVANGTQVAFQIRGIGAVDHQALTPTAAAVHVDGVYLSTNVQNSLLTFDLDRIEVLKGPQGTLYGRNASGGAINFLTVEPGAPATGYAGIRLGTDGLVDVTAALGDRASDNIAWRVAGRALQRDPVLENISGPDEAGGVREELGLRAGVKLADALGGEILISAHYAQDTGINPAPRNSALDLGDHQISIGPDGIQDTDTAFYGARLRWRGALGDAQIIALTGYEGYGQAYGFDFDGTTAPFGNDNLRANLAYDRDLDMISQEIRATTEYDTRRSLYGVYGMVEKFQQDYLIWCGELNPDSLLGTCPYVGAAGRVGPDPVSEGTALSLLSRIDQERASLAAFTHHELDLSPTLTASLGARYTAEWIEARGQGLHLFDDGAVGFNNRDGLGLARGENEITEGRWSGQVGITWAPVENTRVYGSVASGYKSGGFNGEVQNNATHYADEGLFEAETVVSTELGLRHRTDRFDGTLALFHQAYDRPQARIFVPFPLDDGGAFTSNSLSNLDSATSIGLETTGRVTLTDGWSAHGSLTLLDTEIDEPLDPAAPQNAELYDGNPLPFAAPTSAVVGTRYERPLGQGRLHATASAKYQGPYYFDPEGREDRRQAGYTLVNADLAWTHAPSGWQARLWGRNITDQEYALTGYAFIGYNRFIGDPAQWGVAFRREFGGPEK